jgi:hypothetical protein
MYAQQQSEPVVPDRPRLSRLVPSVVLEHVNLEDSPFARHDPERLVRAIFERAAF